MKSRISTTTKLKLYNTCIGATENAGLENAGPLKMQGWKMQDWKTWDQIAGVENAGQPSMEREKFTYA